MSFTLIGCTSNEKDVLDNVQFYTTDDLVEIASEYGIKFQPQKEAVGIHLSQADMDSPKLIPCMTNLIALRQIIIIPIMLVIVL